MGQGGLPRGFLVIVIKDENIFLVEVYHPEDLKVEEEVWLTTVNHFGTYSVLRLERNFEHSENVAKIVSVKMEYVLS